MRFCTNCENMFYMKSGEDGNSLIYYCRNCGTENTDVDPEDLKISSTSSQNIINVSSEHLINKYTKHDTTLPRTNKINCPNSECTHKATDDAAAHNVLFIKYDTDNMKYVYMCCTCDTYWTTGVD